MARVESEGCLCRIKECTLELLSMKESITICVQSEEQKVEEEEEEEEEEEIVLSWELLEQNLRLKSTFMYCDLNRVISVLEDKQLKESTTHLASRFLCSMEELQDVVKIRSISKTQICYNGLVGSLQDLMSNLFPPNSKQLY